MNSGDQIQIKTSKETFKGMLMPDSIRDKLVLKLDSGYNIGIDKKNIKEKKLIKKATKTKSKIKKLKQNKTLKKILILHTGGTIASKVDYKTGGVIARFTPEELLELFPEIKKVANIQSKLIDNLWSGDMRFAHYNIIAKEILKAKDVDGIIITHGTDTMHYTAAALSFMLDNLNIPIILTGAQRSSDRGSSDAAINLLCAANFITKSNFADVGICMHSSMNDDTCYILPGLKTRKMHTSRRDAFQPINAKPIALVDVKGKIKYINQKYNKKEGKKTIKATYFNENLKIGILKAHPNLFAEEITNYSKFDGLIIEGTGLGHLSVDKIDKYTTENEKIFLALKSLKIPVVMCSQTIFGRINLNVYSYGRKIQDYVINGKDMTPETAFIKLAWLLSNKKDPKLIESNLKHEINERISDEFLQIY